MTKGATAVLAVLLGTGCTTGMARTPVQAMLLPPVDGKLALWINQPAYFAVLGTGPERGTEILYQQTALEGVPASGYVYVPTRRQVVPAPELASPDAEYEQVYLVASPTPIDLSAFPGAGRDVDPAARPNTNAGSLQQLFAASPVVDGYRTVRDTLERIVCAEHAALAAAAYDDGRYDPYHVYRVRLVQCERLGRSIRLANVSQRTFFVPMPRLHPPGKRVPPPDRMMLYLAAKQDSRAPGAYSARPETPVSYATHQTTSIRSSVPSSLSSHTSSSSTSSHH